jgi:hypothetical protein
VASGGGDVAHVQATWRASSIVLGSGAGNVASIDVVHVVGIIGRRCCHGQGAEGERGLSKDGSERFNLSYYHVMSYYHIRTPSMLT